MVHWLSWTILSLKTSHKRHDLFSDELNRIVYNISPNSSTQLLVSKNKQNSNKSLWENIAYSSERERETRKSTHLRQQGQSNCTYNQKRRTTLLRSLEITALPRVLGPILYCQHKITLCSFFKHFLELIILAPAKSSFLKVGRYCVQEKS